MSDSHSHGGNAHGGGHSTTGGDMNLKKIILVGVASLILFAVSIIWSYRLMVGRENEIVAGGKARVPTEIGKPEIGIVDQVPFDIDHRLEIWRADHARRLSSYGWVDRRRGIARIPIERAMQQVVSEPPDISGEGVVPEAKVHVPVLPMPMPTRGGVSVPPASSKPAAGTP
jgi:hypothetical protein